MSFGPYQSKHSAVHEFQTKKPSRLFCLQVKPNADMQDQNCQRGRLKQPIVVGEGILLRFVYILKLIAQGLSQEGFSQKILSLFGQFVVSRKITVRNFP